MIQLTSQTQIHLAIEPSDFRKQIDGHVALIKQHLKQDPRSGALYVFINRAKTMIRAISYQDNGYWVATKRLSRGTFRGWPKSNEPVSKSTSKELSIMLKGLSKEVVKKVNSVNVTNLSTRSHGCLKQPLKRSTTKS